MVTPRRQAPRASDGSAPQPAPAPLRGPPGPKGDPGPLGPSVFREISESGSTELYGAHPQGFACRAHGEAPIQCAFHGWDEGDILQIEFWCQALSTQRKGSILIEAQVTLDGGASFHGVSGARLQLAPGIFSASASSSIALPTEPQVRLFAAQYDSQAIDYGDGPEGSTLVLRCTRWTAGTYQPTAELRPPRH